MAFARSLLPAPMARPDPRPSVAALHPSPPSMTARRRSLASPPSPPLRRLRRPASISTAPKNQQIARAELQETGDTLAADALTNVKHVLLPITDRNPYLSEGTRQAAATTTALAKKYRAEITVVVIDDRPKESIPEHDSQLSSIRWHLSEGGFKEFKLMEKLGEEKKPTAIIGEIADDLEQDLVVLSMEAIHSKHVDANLLAEFMPCPVLLLPL